MMARSWWVRSRSASRASVVRVATGSRWSFQDLALCDDLDVAANFYLGREPTRAGFVRVRRMHAEARTHLEEFGIRLQSTSRPVRLLSGGQRQSLAIARATIRRPA